MEFLTELGLEIILVILGVIASAAFSYLKPKIDKALKAIADRDETGIVATLAEQSVELIEARFEELDGEEKFEEALGMLSRRLDSYGLDISEELMRMNIQKGWRAMDEKQRKEGGK